MTKLTYKAFNEDLTCRDFQYEIGKEYQIEGELKPTSNGFHACVNPLDVIEYYDLTSSRFGLVKQSGKTIFHGDKIVSEKIELVRELSFSEYVEHCVSFLLDIGSDRASSKDYSDLSASGNGSKIAAPGHFSKLIASGVKSNLVALGVSSGLAASGKGSKLAALGGFSSLAASGVNSKLAALGNRSQLAALGASSVLFSAGNNSTVRGVNGTLVCLTHYDSEGVPVKFVTGKIGENGLKENVEYILNKNGEFVEA